MSVLEFAPVSIFPATPFFSEDHLPAEVTVRQAADLLCVSEPYMVQLLDSGHIASQHSDGMRLIALKDVLEYQERKKNLRLGVLAKLVKESQESESY